MAKLAASEGAHVAIAPSDQDRIDGTIRKIKDALPSAKITGHVCDISQSDVEAQLEKLPRRVTAAMGGRLDHVVITTDSVEFKPLSATTLESIQAASHRRLVVPALLSAGQGGAQVGEAVAHV